MELARLTVPALGQVKDGQRYAVEGYLFPDTYEFDVSVTPKQILDRMLARLEEVFTAEMRSRCQELGLEVHDVMTRRTGGKGGAGCCREGINRRSYA